MNHPLQNINLAEFNLDPPARALVEQLLNYIEEVTAEWAELKAENQQLRDENARLKGQKSKPKIKGNRPASGPDETSAQSKHRPKSKKNTDQRPPRKERIKIDRTEPILLDREQLPPDVEHRGYREVIIQNIIFQTDNVYYRLERFYSARTGQFYEASLPERVQGQSYGPELEALVIMFYYELRVTEGKILKLLQAQGIVISAGQISNVLIKKHLALFSAERQAVLEAGLQTTIYQQIDDTGARVAGVNHYFTVLCNPYYSCFLTHRYKNQLTVSNLLVCLSASPERELLLVLDFPDVPLHNNESERAVREYVIKRKISNGTRTKEGTQAWEVFLSLVDTCRKNEINFYQYVFDRISKANQMPSLASVVLACAQHSPS